MATPSRTDRWSFCAADARQRGQYRRRRRQQVRAIPQRAEHLCARFRSLAGSAHRRRRARLSAGRQRLDFARFLTADIAEVQIAKGYVSVLDGPGGMGGQINLVSRKPTREIEGELRTRLRVRPRRHVQGTDDLRPRRHEKGHLLSRSSAAPGTNFDGWMLPASYRRPRIRATGIRGQSATQTGTSTRRSA